MFLLLAVGLVVGGLGYWFFIRGSSNRDADSGQTVLPSPHAGPFVPEYDLDPAATAQAAVDPKVRTKVALADGAAVMLQPGAVDKPTMIKIARLTNRPPSLGAESSGTVYDITLEGGVQPQHPVEINLPLGTAPVSERTAIARWEKERWLPVAASIDAARGVAVARVRHFSKYSRVDSNRFTTAPPVLELFPPGSVPDTPDRRVPRGGLVECVAYLVPDYDEVRQIGGGETNDLEFDDGAGKFTGGIGKLRRGADGTECRFIVRVPPGVKLGPRDLGFYSSKGLSAVKYPAALLVSNPLVVIVNIDGMRQDVFQAVIAGKTALGPAACPNLQALFGKRTAAAPGPAGTLAHRLEFEKGVALPETTTVFPTVTFAGHASIATGEPLNKLGLAGNEWFDRFEEYKFAFTGDNIGLGAGDAKRSFSDGFANERLLKSGVATLYQRAAADPDLRARSIVIHNMYYGVAPAADWRPQGLLDQAAYVPCWSTHFNDGAMLDKASAALAEGARSPELAVLMVYFAGLDHRSHIDDEPLHVEDRFEGSPVAGKQSIYLHEEIDPLVGGLIQEMTDALCKNTVFVFTADHGQTTMAHQKSKLHHFGESRSNPGLHKFQDLLYELGYSPHGRYHLVKNDPGQTWAIKPADATAVIGCNGGMTHIYLRRVKGNGPPTGRTLKPFRDADPVTYTGPAAREVEQSEDWSAPPLKSQVFDVAQRFWLWSKNGWAPAGRENEVDDKGNPNTEPDKYRGSLEFILWRDPEKGLDSPYLVYRHNQESIPLLDYLLEDLQQNGDNSFLKRNGWNDRRDAEFLVDRLRRLEGRMSGDLILIPRYPDFYCEYMTQFGDHGSFNRNDFEVPFAVAQPGAGERRMKFIKDVLADPAVIELGGGKNRPSNSDIPKTVLKLLKPPPFEAPTQQPTGAPVYHVYKGQVDWQGPTVVTNHDFGGSSIVLVFEVSGDKAELYEATVVIGGGEIKVGERFGPTDKGWWVNPSNRLVMKPEYTIAPSAETASVAGKLDCRAQNDPQYSFRAALLKKLTSEEFSGGDGDVYKAIIDAAYAEKPARKPNLPPRQDTPRGRPLIPQ